MRHTRFDVATLRVDGTPILLKAAYVLVAERDGRPELDWECLVYALGTEPLEPQRYEVDLVTLDGRALSGPAVLVRSVEGAHVLRGDGPLAGVVAGDLDRGGGAGSAGGQPGSDPAG